MAKRRFRKRVGKRRFRRKRPFYKSKLRKQVLTNRIPQRFHMPLPPRFRTKLTITNQGFLAGGISSNQMFGVYGNRLTSPFNMGDGYTALTNALVGVGGSFPCGFSNLIGAAGIGPYTNYKVYASRILVQPTCEGSGDTFYLCVAPAVVANPANEGVNVVYGGFTTLQQGPYSKMRVVNVGMNGRISNYMDTATIFGQTRRSIQDDKGFEGSSTTPPLNRWAWIIAMNQSDNVNNTNPVAYSITVDYYVEFANPAQAGLLDN